MIFCLCNIDRYIAEYIHCMSICFFQYTSFTQMLFAMDQNGRNKNKHCFEYNSQMMRVKTSEVNFIMHPFTTSGMLITHKPMFTHLSTRDAKRSTNVEISTLKTPPAPYPTERYNFATKDENIIPSQLGYRHSWHFVQPNCVTRQNHQFIVRSKRQKIYIIQFLDSAPWLVSEHRNNYAHRNLAHHSFATRVVADGPAVGDDRFTICDHLLSQSVVKSPGSVCSQCSTTGDKLFSVLKHP